MQMGGGFSSGKDRQVDNQQKRRKAAVEFKKHKCAPRLISPSSSCLDIWLTMGIIKASTASA